VLVCILSEKAVLEMTYTVSGRTLDPTHSLTFSVNCRNDCNPGIQITRISPGIFGLQKCFFKYLAGLSM